MPFTAPINFRIQFNPVDKMLFNLIQRKAGDFQFKAERTATKQNQVHSNLIIIIFLPPNQNITKSAIKKNLLFPLSFFFWLHRNKKKN